MTHSAGVAAALVMQQFGQTTRYHTQMTLKTQDVAQHSFNVAWFCWLLTGGKPSVELIMSALAHDAGERATGDLPAPTKRALGLTPVMDDLEDAYTTRAGWAAPALSSEEAQVLKLADVLDGCFFCLREVMLGNRLVTNHTQDRMGLTYLSYLQEFLHSKLDSPTATPLARELHSYLKAQYDEHLR